MSELLYIVGDWMMIFAIVGMLTFSISYGFFFAWRKTNAGKALMYLVLALDGWAIQSYLARMDPDYPLREWARVIVYAAIMVTVWGLVITLWKSWGDTFEFPNRRKPRG